MKQLLALFLVLFGLAGSASAQYPDAAIEGYNTNHKTPSGADWFRTNFSLAIWLYDPVGYDVYRVTIYMTDADGSSNSYSISSGVDWQPSRPTNQNDWYVTTFAYDGSNYEYKPTAFNNADWWDAQADGVGGWQSNHYVSSMTVEFGYWYWDTGISEWMVDVQYTAVPYYYNGAIDNVMYQCYYHF